MLVTCISSMHTSYCKILIHKHFVLQCSIARNVQIALLGKYVPRQKSYQKNVKVEKYRTAMVQNVRHVELDITVHPRMSKKWSVRKGSGAYRVQHDAMNALVDLNVLIRTAFPHHVHLDGLRQRKTQSRAKNVLLALFVPIHGILQNDVHVVSLQYIFSSCQY